MCYGHWAMTDVKQSVAKETVTMTVCTQSYGAGNYDITLSLGLSSVNVFVPDLPVEFRGNRSGIGKRKWLRGIWMFSMELFDELWSVCTVAYWLPSSV